MKCDIEGLGVSEMRDFEISDGPLISMSVPLIDILALVDMNSAMLHCSLYRQFLLSTFIGLEISRISKVDVTRATFHCLT